VIQIFIPNNNINERKYIIDIIFKEFLGLDFKLIIDNGELKIDNLDKNCTSVFAQYSIRVKNRDEVQAKLKEQGIPTAVHYPMPLHLQECFEYLEYKKGDFPIAEEIANVIISLPMNPYIKQEEILYISKHL